MSLTRIHVTYARTCHLPTRVTYTTDPIYRACNLRYDLDWAYWSLNGDRWDEAQRTWRDEWYGVLGQDYSTVRNPHMFADLARLMNRSATG